MTAEIECALIEKCHFIEVDLWERDYLDLMQPAYISFEDNGHGEMDEGSVGDSAELDDDDSLKIEIRFHLCDETILKAHKL